MTDTETARELLWRHNLPEDVIDGTLALHAQELAALQRQAHDERRPYFHMGLPCTPGFGCHVAELIDLITPGGTEEARLHDPASAGVVPAADRAGLRDLIAEALADVTGARWPAQAFLTEADAVLSVLPVTAGQADRAAAFEEAAAAIEHEQDRQDAEQVARFGSLDHECAMQGEAVRAKAAMLRRMAAVPAGSADAGHSGSETAGCGCPSEDDPEHMFGGENCDCIPFTRQEKPPRYLNRPTDTVDMISGWEIGQNCPHHRAAAGQSAGGAHFCGNCEGIDPDTCLTNPDRPVSEARQETNPAQDEAPGQWCKCRSCWGWFIEEHPGEDLDELGRDLAWWSGLPAHRDAPDGVEAGREVVHGCPPDGSGLTPCCGRTPFELPLTDRISSEVPVTCKGADRG